MSIEPRDVITGLSVIVAFIGMMLVNRNAKRALRPAAENTDLTRIRDLRQELRETKDEVSHLRVQITDMSIQLNSANERSMAYARREVEMIQYAQMPGVTMDDWRRRFDVPPALNATQ